MMMTIKKYYRDERGSTGIIFALTLVPMAVLAGGSVDYGKVLAERTKMQAAADAAALAAAQVGSADVADREAIAKRVFVNNMIGAAKSVTPAVTVSGDTVKVDAKAAIGTPFLSIVKIPTLDAIVSASAKAGDVLETKNSGKVCILALDPQSDDGIHLQGDNQVRLPDCWAHTNSEKVTAINANGNNAKAIGKGFCAVGAWTQTHETFSPLPTGSCQVVKDPFATVGAYEVGSYQPTFTPPTKAVTCKASNLNLKKGVFTLDPGRYCGGITVMAGATVTFRPGIYYIDSGAFDVRSGASISGSNVLFYLEGANASMTVIGGGTINLSGRTSTASYAGFLMIANPNANPMGTNNIQGGGTFKMQGVLYMPKNRIEVSGNGDVNNSTLDVFGMVAKDFYFRGNGVFNTKKHSGSGSVPDIMPSMPAETLNKTVLR